MVNLFLVFIYRLKLGYTQKSFLVIPFGDIELLMTSERFKFKRLIKPIIPESRVDGVVTDPCFGRLPGEWERFLVLCVLKRIPVFELMNFNEVFIGKVNLDHLTNNDHGVLAPSKIMMDIKQLIDILFIILILPVIIPLILMITLCIRVDSPGGALFIQKRVGYMGKPFNMVKFRTMVVDHGGSIFTEADESHRITKVGKIIRKFRLDELPQFWNILRGEMSLIGPRPESIELARWYEKEIPFFEIRHIVRPGISGWAQVKHGYAAGLDEMKEKIAYDLYYIKHFSPWLDMLILHKTIKTVISGFGSR